MKVIPHFKPPGVSGGVEKYERELMDIVLDIESQAVLFNIGNFFDNILARILSLYYPKIFAVSHVNENWRHISNKWLKSITIHLLNTSKIQVLLIGENQRNIYNLKLHPQMLGTFTRSNLNNFKDNRVIPGRTKPFALYYGRLNAEKNILDLIDTWQRVTTKDLVIIGSSSSESYRQMLVSKVREYENIMLYDYMSFDRLSVYIDKCDYGVIHSLSDTVPLMFVEMYQRGKWCLVNSRCSLPEYLPPEYSYELDNDDSLVAAIRAIECRKHPFVEGVFNVVSFKERLNEYINKK